MGSRSPDRFRDTSLRAPGCVDDNVAYLAFAMSHSVSNVSIATACASTWVVDSTHKCHKSDVMYNCSMFAYSSLRTRSDMKSSRLLPDSCVPSSIIV